PGPRVDLPALEGRTAVRVRQVHVLDVGLREPRLMQRLKEEEVRVGALLRRDLLALEVADVLRGRILRDDERGPLGLLVDVDRLDGVPVRAGEERRGACRR